MADTQELQPMAEGGRWLQLSDQPPIYVVHPEHVKRLIQEGAMPCEDPRIAAQISKKASK